MPALPSGRALCIEICERQLDAANRLYVAGDSDKGKAALADVTAFAELARDYAIQSHKQEKQSEIAIRKMTRKLADLKHTVSHEDQTQIQKRNRPAGADSRRSAGGDVSERREEMKALPVSMIAGMSLLALLAGNRQRRSGIAIRLRQAEIDQIRDTSWEPQLRLGLYVKFARARLVGMEQMRADPKTKDRAQQTHDKLDDFLLIYDELNDNIDTYVDRKNDIRKPLKLIIDADTEFQAKLLALRDAAGVSPEEFKQYEFVLSNALDTVDSTAEDHQQTAGRSGRGGEASEEERFAEREPVGVSCELSRLKCARGATTGAKARSFLASLRGAEAPLFHGAAGGPVCRRRSKASARRGSAGCAGNVVVRAYSRFLHCALASARAPVGMTS